MSRFDDYKIEILYTIWLDAYRPGSVPSFSKNDLGKVLPADKISGLSYAVLDYLQQDDHLEQDNGNRYSISLSGIQFIESGLADPQSDVSRVVRTLERAGGTQPPEPLPVPASDRIVTLEHNSDPYKEAIEALDEAVKAFKEDRSFDNEWTLEKSVLLQTIEGGRGLLRGAQVSAATIYATIITPLRVIREKYEHSIAAGLVTAGFDQLATLLGRAMSSISALIGLS